MPKIFEIFGYPIDDLSEEAEQNRRAAHCPFMNRDCDGGGNRYLSQIDLSRNAVLKAIFPNRSKVAAGVCSIQVKADTAPWIVWRMVSQLIVKSEIALSWGGKTIWVVQDLLVDYICASTALNVRQFLSENTSQVNMLSFSYGTGFEITRGVVELLNPQLFAGLIASTTADSTPPMPSFQDIIRAPTCPPLDRVMVALARRKPINQVIVP